MIVVPNIAERYDLDAFLDHVTAYYHLLVADVPLGPATELGSLVEADWPAYAPQRVGAWTPSVTVGGRAAATADPLSWTRGTGGEPRLVYGYWVTDNIDGPLLWAERRPQGALPMVEAADRVVLLPRLTGREDPEAEGQVPEDGPMANFADNEVPGGAVDGVNATFTLASVPVVGSVRLYKNGLRQTPGGGNDYTIAGDTIVFAAGNVPQAGDVLLCDYRY